MVIPPVVLNPLSQLDMGCVRAAGLQANMEHLRTFNFHSTHRRRNIQELFDALSLLHFLFYFIHREVIDSSTRQLIARP